MHHTRAIILKKEEWNEADWLVTALTEQFGKIRLMAQGARKHGAKLQGHLEIGSLSDISFVIGRNGYRLTAARLRTFPALSRGSLAKLQALSAILASLDANLLEEREGAQELFALLTETLMALERMESDGALQRIVIWFEVCLIALLGMLPSTDAPEARYIPSLHALASQPLAVLAGLALSETELERELAWLRSKLGGSLGLAGATAPTGSALY